MTTTGDGPLRRDGRLHSLWQDTVPASPTDEEISGSAWDVAIVGAGITGLTTALRLAKAGRRCLLLEARNPGFGTTGGTTAHLNTVLDFSYPTVRRGFGEDGARLLAKGLHEAMALIRDNVQDHTEGCGFRLLPSYTYCTSDDQRKQLEEMLHATRDAGVSASWVDQAPIPFPHTGAMMVPGQAQLHPLRYLHGLLRAFRSLGGVLVENCRVTGLDEEEDGCRLSTARGAFRAGHVVYATHIPPGVDLLHFRCAPYRSYALAADLQAGTYPEALLYDMEDPYHYYRTQVIDGRPSLIAGGEDHKTGHGEDTRAHFTALEAHVRRYFPVEAVTHRWSSQYFEPADSLPYIGRLPGHGPRVWVATGYGGNGMMLGTLAAIVLEEAIVHGGGPYAKLFDPGRVGPVAGFGNFAREAADVAAHFLSKPFLGEHDVDASALAPGEGRLLRHGGNITGLYKDDTGALHAVDPACTHIRCTVKWNRAERTWDCPCHGSRFDVDGRMLTGPARRDLRTVPFDTSSGH